MSLVRCLVDVFFPPRCAACGQAAEGELFCPACLRRVARVTNPVCRHCAAALLHPSSPTCLRCAQEPWPCDRFAAAFHYAGPVRDALLAFKHSGRVELADRLADAAFPLVAPLLQGTPDLVVAVPMHGTRLARRGFNQAALLAARMASRLDAACAARMLVRTRHTGSQGGLSLSERRRNVAGAFAWAGPKPGEGSSVLIVDDVVASGATICECARVLRAAGFARVDAWAVARPPLSDFGTFCTNRPIPI
jgi:ComF family protein